MKTQEITQSAWIEFCNRVREFCRGSLVTIELQQPDGSTETIAQDVALREIALDDKSDPCNTNLVIEAGTHTLVRHVVVEPIHIRLRHDGTGDRYNQVQIVAENGTTTVAFRPGLSPEILEGLKLQ